jgi:hypothetical protein
MKREAKKNKNDALEALFWRDEILQVLYWMEGERLSDAPSIKSLQPLLNSDIENLHFHLQRLTDQGYLEKRETGAAGDTRFQLSAKGRKEAGKRFAQAFQGMQKAGHGECSADCDCQWEGHDACRHHHIS